MKTLEGLPVGTTYTVVEDENSLYETTSTGGTGTIGDTVSMEIFTNTYYKQTQDYTAPETEDLKVRKTVTNPGDIAEKYNLHISLENLEPDTTYSLIKTFTKTEEVLDTGAVEVKLTEISFPANGFYYTLGETVGYRVTVTNKTDEYIDEYSISLSESLAEYSGDLNPQAQAQSLETITVEPLHLENGLQETLTFTFGTSTYTLKLPIDVESTDESKNPKMSFESDENGQVYFDFRLKKDEVLIFKDLPVGTKYIVREDGGKYINSYSLSDEHNGNNIVSVTGANTSQSTDLSTAKETIESNETITITFNNELKLYEDLIVEMRIDSGPMDYVFDVDVVFDNLEPGQTYNSPIGRIVADDEGHAEKSFRMKHGDLLTFKQLPVGTRYRFTENKSGYVVNYEISDHNSVSSFNKEADENDKGNMPLSTQTETISEKSLQHILFINRMVDKAITVTKR